MRFVYHARALRRVWRTARVRDLLLVKRSVRSRRDKEMTEENNPMFVSLLKRNGEPYRWVVKVTINKERKYVGCFETKQEAITALTSYMKKQQYIVANKRRHLQ